MNYKRMAGMLLVFVLFAFPASASMVCFFLVETGLGEDALKLQHSSLWESGLMAAFFDAGHVVTNSPISRMEKRPSQDISGQVENELGEAFSGGAEYFVLGFLEYQIRSTGPLLTGIALKLYTTDTRELVFEQHFPAGTGKSLGEEYQFAQNAGQVIISHLKDR